MTIVSSSFFTSQRLLRPLSTSKRFTCFLIASFPTKAFLGEESLWDSVVIVVALFSERDMLLHEMPDWWGRYCDKTDKDVGVGLGYMSSIVLPKNLSFLRTEVCLGWLRGKL